MEHGDQHGAEMVHVSTGGWERTRPRTESKRKSRHKPGAGPVCLAKCRRRASDRGAYCETCKPLMHERIRALRREGSTLTEITRAMELSLSTVHKVLSE